MIRPLDDVERRPLPQASAYGLEQRQFGEVIPRALQKQHRNPDRVEMIGPSGPRPTRRMQRKPEEYEPPDVGKGMLRLGAGRHPATKGLPACEEGHPGCHASG